MSEATPLLATKLTIPSIRSQLVPRPRLSAQLEAGLQRRLILVVAPAGWGKSSLVSTWLHAVAPHLPAAWVALDAADADFHRFWRYVVAALDCMYHGVSDSLLPLLQSPQPPGMEMVVTTLLNALSHHTTDAVLVLDDYHVIDNPAVHQSLQFLLDHLPRHLHVVLVTRMDPPLPLARWRARGELIEIRALHLRFTRDEAAQFLKETMGLALGREEVAALEARTEGWVAGLQLAALALRDREDVASFIRTFTGSNRFVLDYLVEEVVARQPSHLQAFLLRTSILDRLCAPLCDAVMGLTTGDREGSTGAAGHVPRLPPRTASGAAYSQLIVDQLERANAFIVALDDERYWYRYHHLFADALRERLVAGATPAEIAILYRRASEWCETHGLIAEAIQYAFGGQDTNRAADLLEQHRDTVALQGGPGVVVGWIARLPRDALDVRPRLALTYAWALVFTDRFAEAESLLQAAERAMAVQTNGERSLLAEQVAALRASMALLQAHPPDAIIAAARHALALMADPRGPLRGTVSLMLGCAYALKGDDRTALEILEESAAVCRMNGDGFMEVHTLTHIIRTLIYRGQLRRAEALAQDVLQRADADHLRAIPTRGHVWAMLAWILYERNDLDAAQRCAEDAIDVCKAWSMPRILLHAYVPLALVHRASGDVAGAHMYIDEALRLIERDHLKQTFISVTAYQARLWLMEGNLAAAAQWSYSLEATIQGRLDPELDVDHLMLARVFLAQGRLADAEQLLERLIAQAEAQGRERRVVEGYVVQALVARARGKHEPALTALTRALTLAAREGYVRTFVDEGVPMQALLHDAAAHGIMPHYVARLLAAFPREQKAEPGIVGVAERSVQPSSLIAEPSVEPLSEREREVLVLVATGLSNQAIAGKLIVGHNTVKKHLSNIYAKLGVHSRTEALARARDLHLL